MSETRNMQRKKHTEIEKQNEKKRRNKTERRKLIEITSTATNNERKQMQQHKQLDSFSAYY